MRALPGQQPEENGQGAAIAQNLLTLSQLPVPVLTVIFGEGGSGGALALAGGDEVWMLAHSTYSILSPEGFASILWKDSRKAPQAAELMQLTPTALKQAGIIEGIIPEPRDHQKVIAAIDKVIAPFASFATTGSAGFIGQAAATLPTILMQLSLTRGERKMGKLLTGRRFW